MLLNSLERKGLPLRVIQTPWQLTSHHGGIEVKLKELRVVLDQDKKQLLAKASTIMVADLRTIINFVLLVCLVILILALVA